MFNCNATRSSKSINNVFLVTKDFSSRVETSFVYSDNNNIIKQLIIIITVIITKITRYACSCNIGGWLCEFDNNIPNVCVRPIGIRERFRFFIMRPETKEIPE